MYGGRGVGGVWVGSGHATNHNPVPGGFQDGELKVTWQEVDDGERREEFERVSGVWGQGVRGGGNGRVQI